MNSDQLLEDAIASDIPFDAHIMLGILPWGLGHAARCVPIIDALQKKKYPLKIYTGRESYQLLRGKFPEADIVNGNLPPISLKGNIAIFHLLRNLSTLLTYYVKSKIFIRKEMKKIENLVVVSDNFPGFYTPRAIRNIYITHQIKVIGHDLKVSKLLSWLHCQIWKRYDFYWLPDHPEIRLAGMMSSPPTHKYRYIGLLSRFTPEVNTICNQKRILILLSGPEPQRTYLENQLLEIIGKINSVQITLVRGIKESEGNPINFPGHWKIYHIVQDGQLEEEIRLAGTIISRCGYSTLMEIFQTNAKIICIPTPGQFEQIYLASRIASKENRYWVDQKNILRDLPSLLLA